MPLYSVTCGDIGTNADAVEKYLNTVLYLGKTWNCGRPSLNPSIFRRLPRVLKFLVVLLLDEADVFLEERSMADLERNSLVSGLFSSLSPCLLAKLP